ncbi:MAG: hypothetical protein RL410_521 [Actinomycetota bacterium]|jgi:tRNA pseudouridine38-40 synthase
MPEKLKNEPSPPLGRGFVRLRIDLAYDGSLFAGWAEQPALRTVQGEVQRAIGTVFHLGRSAEVIVAGRTDAGVHARGQVLHTDIPAELVSDFGKATIGMNALLGGDIQIKSIAIAPAGFDARFSAIARRYSYTIADGIIDPLARHFVVSRWRALDIDAMNQASKALIGLHDFTSFCKQNDYGTSIRTLQKFEWHRGEHGAVAELQADAFCHSMVRSLIGALVPVGEGRQPISFPAEVLSRRARSGDVVTMPGHGLVLEEVIYPDESELLARQEMTRAKRDITEVSS